MMKRFKISKVNIRFMTGILLISMLTILPFASLFSQTTVTKYLYLSDPSQALDRIDPVASTDNTTASTARLQAVADGVTAGTTTTGQSNATQTLTISHNVVSGFNRLLMVSITTGATTSTGTNAATINTVKYGNVDLQPVGSVNAGGNVRAFLYSMVAPPVGTASLVITTSASTPIAAGVTTYYGVNQSAPLGTFASNSSTSNVNTGSITGIVSATNEIIHDVIAVDMDNTAITNLNQGGSQFQNWRIYGTTSGRVNGASSYKVGAASQTMSWTWSTSSQQYAMGAVPIKPAVAVPTATFTQNPVLCNALTVKSGTSITASIYLTVLSGSMPANPTITAALKYGATTIATLSAPTYNSGTGLLSFTGTIASDVTVPTGQAIVADITTAQSGVSFQIDYDSQTKPSKIGLPVSTYINISNLAVYNAVYPSGSVITNIQPGTTVYVRSTVTDPFGFGDITGMTINITPTVGTVTATSVATTGCNRIYEYMWNTTGLSENTYTLNATAKEGLENTVTDSEQITFSVCTPIGTPVFSSGATSNRCVGAGSVTYSATSTNSTGISYSLDATSLSAGNTINSSNGQVTYTAGWSGTSVITATASGCDGPKTAQHNATTLGTLGTPVFALGATSSRCKEAGTTTYTATATNSTGITYSLDAISLSAGNTINSATGQVTYTAAWSGYSTITATASGCGGPKTATHVVKVKAALAINDNASGYEGNVTIVNVAVNDLCDIDVNSITIIDVPVHGSVQNGVGGSVIYAPNPGYSGNDQFSYRICNNGSPQECDTAIVYITIEENVFDACAEANKTHIYYLPFPENATQLRKSLLSAASVNNLTANARNIVTIKVPYPGMVITYDQWEDGYESDITRPDQTSTLVWGDGILDNGVAPGYPTDTIPPGGYLILDNRFEWNPRVSSTLAYDGKDKMFSTGDIVVSKITGDGGITGSTPIFNVQAVKTSVVDITRFGTYFILPFGENVTLGSTSAFKYSSVFVRASQNNTTVQLDYNADGVYDVSTVLNEGEVWLYDGTASSPGVAGDINQSNDIKAGAKIIADKPVGVDMVFGGIDNYGTRNIPVLPGQFYANSYHTPIYTSSPADVPVYMFFTNSTTNPITINWTNNSTSGSLVVAANSYNYFNVPYSASGTGYRFYSQGGETFTAVAVIDADAAGSTYDWAYNLMPTERLTSFLSVAWAPGSSNLSGNYNPVWVTATANTTLYIKYDGNFGQSTPTMSPCGLPYDIAIPVTALGSYKIYDNADNDQSGLSVYTCDENVGICGIWGQDSYANGSNTPTASPAIDVGYFLEPRCLRQLVFANNDYVVTEPEKPIIIKVSSNDFAFLSTLDKSSVSTVGLLQPANGTIVVNADGTITYTPNPGFEGTDTFEYNICSLEYPNLCDIATVTVRVANCATTSSQNQITGIVFVEQLPDDGTYNNEAPAAGVQVDLYADLDCDGIVDTNENIINSKTTDLSGNYSFSVRNGYGAKDEFNAVAFNGNDGGLNWSANWIEQTDNGVASTGFVTIANDVIPDAGGGNAIRLSNDQTTTRGISRTFNFSGATSAVLKFRYRRQSLDNNGEALNISVNGTTVLSFDDGDANGTDVNYLPVVYPLSSYNANGTNTVLFSVNNLVNSDDYYWVDDVELVYFKGNSCYIVKVDPTNTGGAYSTSLLNSQPAQFNGLGVCERLNNLGVLANLVATDDAVNCQIDVPVVINVLGNDVIGKPNPSTVSFSGVTNFPANGTVLINPDGTITYTPNPGFTGVDDFEYKVCSLEDPGVCDIAKVTVTISCISISQKNVISGVIYRDGDVDGIYDSGEGTLPDVLINLYRDVDNNGSLNAGDVLVDVESSDNIGAYSFEINPTTATSTYKDNFNVDNLPNQSHGTASWLTSWTKIGDSGAFDTGDITITAANGLRIQTVASTVKGAYRIADLSNANSATLSFKYTESGMDLDVNEYVDVQVASSASPTSWTLLKRITGANGNQTETLSFDISNFRASTTTIRIVTNSSANMGSGDIVYLDDVQISFEVPQPESFILQLKQPINDVYVLTYPTPAPTGILTASFTGAGQGACQKNFGLAVRPLAKNDINTTFVNTPVPGNVITNDIDPDGHPLTVTAQPSGTTTNGGTYVLNSNGTYTYTPANGFTGEDTFNYQVCDNKGLCDIATVTIDVIGKPTVNNDPPIATNDAYLGIMNRVVSGNVITNDFDPDQNLNGTSVVLTGALPNPLTQGVLSLNANGTFTFVPVTGFTGQVTFTYDVCDTGMPVYCDNAVATIDILPPITGFDITFANDDAYIGEKGTQITGNLKTNDNDTQSFTQTVTTTPVVAPLHGNVVINSNGTFTYTPSPNFTGTDSFVYETCNNDTPQTCNKATVYLNVFSMFKSCLVSNKNVTPFIIR